MILKNYLPVLQVLLLSALTFLAHFFLFYFFETDVFVKSLQFSLVEIYTFFSVSAALIVLFLIKVKQKNIDSVGFAFLLLTFIKMGVAYAWFYSILAADDAADGEKINFFIVFAVFLTIETVISVRILNNKQ